MDAGVAPARVLPRHSDGEVRDDLHDPRPPGGASLVGPRPGDELLMPTQDGVGSDKRSNFAESPSPDGLASNREPPALIVGQPESLVPELLLEDLILLSELVDDRILLAADPASHGGY